MGLGQGIQGQGRAGDKDIMFNKIIHLVEAGRNLLLSLNIKHYN